MRYLVVLLAILTALLGAGATCLAAETGECAERGLIAPPAIYIPYGGNVVTELNLSDDDVLGVIKQVIPAVGEVLTTVGQATPPKATLAGMPPSALGKLDLKGFSDAIAGIKNVRVLIARYGVSTDAVTMLRQLDTGAGKAGKFSKVLSDRAIFPGVLALYAQPNNGGYMGFAYDTDNRTLYAARVVGFVDVAKFTKWAVDLAKTFIPTVMRVPAEPTPTEAPEPAPQPEPAPPVPESN